MKKILIFCFIAFVASINNEMKSQAIVNPIGEDIMIIDIDPTSSDIVLINVSSGEAMPISSVSSLTATISYLAPSTYSLEYSVGNSRYKMRFKNKK